MILIEIRYRLDPCECVGLKSGIEAGNRLCDSTPHQFRTGIRYRNPNFALCA
jgi:hypothetical protein